MQMSRFGGLLMTPRRVVDYIIRKRVGLTGLGRTRHRSVRQNLERRDIGRVWGSTGNFAKIIGLSLIFQGQIGLGRRAGRVLSHLGKKWIRLGRIKVCFRLKFSLKSG